MPKPKPLPLFPTDEFDKLSADQRFAEARQWYSFVAFARDVADDRHKWAAMRDEQKACASSQNPSAAVRAFYRFHSRRSRNQ